MGQIYNWKKKFGTQGDKAFPGKGHLSELAALRRQLREVEMERDILKKAVGIFSKPTDNGLTTQAMRQAILRRSPAKGLICHSDRGSQYAGHNFKEILSWNEFVGSMSRKGDCWHNAVAESFFHTLNVGLVHRNRFRTRDEAKRMIFEDVEMYYNRKRAHSTLGFLSPVDYERWAGGLNE